MAKRKAKVAEPERLITSDHLKMLARVLSVYDKHMEALHWDMADVLPTLPNEGEADLFRNVRLLRRLAEELGGVVNKAFEAQFEAEQARVGYVLKKIKKAEHAGKYELWCTAGQGGSDHPDAATDTLYEMLEICERAWGSGCFGIKCPDGTWFDWDTVPEFPSYLGSTVDPSWRKRFPKDK